MKVFFSAALTQRGELQHYYARIIAFLKKEKATVFEHVSTTSLESLVAMSLDERREYYLQVEKSIQKADLVVLEVSFPSTLTVGHELSLAAQLGKPVLALYQAEREPAFLLGLNHELVIWESYTTRSLERVLRVGLSSLRDHSQVRYNVTLTAEQYRFLDRMAQVHRIPKSYYLRRLINEKISGEFNMNDFSGEVCL